jgi:hypothetical protein
MLQAIIAAAKRRYRAAVLEDSPVAYWRLGEPNGAATAIDEKGAYNGTYVGSPQGGVAGALADNTAITIDADAEYIQAPAGVGNITSESITVEFWIKPARLLSTSSATGMIPISRGASGVGGWYLVINSNGSIVFSTRQSATSQSTVSSTGVVSTGAWHHIVATRNGAVAKIYVNGADVTATPATHVNPDAYGVNLQIGRYTGAGWNAYGDYDEVAIYSTALSAARVLAHYQAAARIEPWLEAYYSFVAATGATDTSTILALCQYLGAQGLWTSCRFFPFKSAQNKGSGTTVYGLGGWTSNNIALVNGPTWGASGVAFDATDDRATWDGTGIEGLSELYIFDRQAPTNASLADTARFSGISFGDGSANPTQRFLFSGFVTGSLSLETYSSGLTNAADIRRFGTTQSWSAGADTQFVTRLAQTGSDIWRSKSTTTKVTPSGTQDYRPSQAGWTANSVVNVSALYGSIAGYSLFVATTRVALLLCKTSLTTLQRETITDYLDAL